MHDAPFSFEQPGGVGAKMRPGRGGPSGEDVIFMDLRKGLFAVADGAGRASGASHRFMAKFARMVLGFRGIDWVQTRRSSEMLEVFEQFKTSTESILADISYGEASTFTALLVLRCDTGSVGLLCHCGDSLLFQFDPETGLRQVSQTNFWMVGRSKRLYQTEGFPAPAGSIFVLATDGISDLRFSEPARMKGCLARSIQENPVEAVPGDLLARYDVSTSPVDDLALIVVRPEGLGPSQEQVFITAHGVDCHKGGGFG